MLSRQALANFSLNWWLLENYNDGGAGGFMADGNDDGGAQSKVVSAGCCALII